MIQQPLPIQKKDPCRVSPHCLDFGSKYGYTTDIKNLSGITQLYSARVRPKDNTFLDTYINHSRKVTKELVHFDDMQDIGLPKAA